MPKYVNTKYNITGGDINHVNTDLDGDIKVFIDPALLNNLHVNNFDAITAKNKINSFFTTVINLYRSGKKNDAAKLFTNFSENNAFGLGYSHGGRKGKGLSTDMLIGFFDKLYSIEQFDTEELSNPALYQMYIHDFDKDRFTDLILTIISKELADFTVLEAIRLNIPLTKKLVNIGSFWDGQNFNPLTQKCILNNNHPVVLIPYRILTKKYAYSIENFLRNIILPIKQSNYKEQNNGNTITKRALLNEIHKDYPNRGYLKDYGLDKTLENPLLMRQYLSFIKTINTSAHSIPLASTDDIN